MRLSSKKQIVPLDCGAFVFKGTISGLVCATPWLFSYTVLVGFKENKNSLYCSTQTIHCKYPSTKTNSFPSVDIKPQFLQTCIFGADSFMLISMDKLYRRPRLGEPTLL